MTTLADATSMLQRFLGRMVEAAPTAWRHDPVFRGAAIGSGVTLAVLLLHLVGPHAPGLEMPGSHYDVNARRIVPNVPVSSAPTPAAEPVVPKITPGQPLGTVTVTPTPGTDRFGTFSPGKRP